MSQKLQFGGYNKFGFNPQSSKVLKYTIKSNNIKFCILPQNVDLFIFAIEFPQLTPIILLFT
jgi:hypothetical protein